MDASGYVDKARATRALYDAALAEVADLNRMLQLASRRCKDAERDAWEAQQQLFRVCLEGAEPLAF